MHISRCQFPHTTPYFRFVSQRIVDQFQRHVSESHDRLMDVIGERKSAILNKTGQKMEDFANRVISNSLAIRNSVEDNERCFTLLSETLSESNHLKFLEVIHCLSVRRTAHLYQTE